MTSLPPARPDQRRSRRFRFHVDVDISDRRGVRRGRAVDVARHGLFVSVVDPPHNRHLVQVVIHLPAPFTGTVQAAATVSRTLAGQGVGLSLFALADDAKARWDHFITALQTQQQQLQAQPQSTSTTTQPHPATTQPPPSDAPGIPSFLLRLKTQERLAEFERTHVKVGGTVLFTPVLLPEGAPVAVVVVHPRTEQEHVLLGRVYRAIAKAPKRIEILFADVDHAAFAAFVTTGAVQKPAPKPTPAPSLPPISTVAPKPPLTEPPHPTTSLAPTTVLPQTLLPQAALPQAGDDDLDIEVYDEKVEDDPIEWDLRTSDLPVLMGRSLSSPPRPATTPPTKTTSTKAPTKKSDDDDFPSIGARGDQAAELSDIFHVSVVDEKPVSPSLPSQPSLPSIADPVTDEDPRGDSDVDRGFGDAAAAEDELVIDDTQVARDPGLRPTPLRVSCDACNSEPYVVELGPCGGVLGLVADLVPFWSTEQGRIVAVPRLVVALERRERFHTYLKRGGQIEDVVALGTFLAAADLAEPAVHPDTAEPLKTSRAIERLGLAGRRVADEDVVAPTRVQCPHCTEGHLVVERA